MYMYLILNVNVNW